MSSGIYDYGSNILEQIADDRKRTTERLRGVNSFLDSIVENIPDMIFVKDAAELRFVRFNKAGEELLGYKREELIGKNDYDFFPEKEADFFIQKDREVLRGGKVVEILEEPIHTRAKGLRYLHTKKIPILDEKGQPLYLLGISEDITEKKRAIREEQRNRELERSNIEHEQFASIVSHDLKEPLRTISMFLELLQKQYRESLDTQANEYIKYAVDGAARTDALLSGLLEYSKAGACFEPLQLVEAAEALQKARQNLESLVKASNAQISFTPLPRVHSNIHHLTQIFQNLISNAIKYRGDKPPSISISAVSSDEFWIFSVEDNGIGIDRKFHEKIFKIFQRLPEARKQEGTGMGLSICRRIVERNGGKIWVDSHLGCGTTFHFSVPK